MRSDLLGPPSAGLTPEEKKKAFLKRWIPWGIAKLIRAEAYGIDWENIPLENLEMKIILAEEFAKSENANGPH